MGLSAFNTAAHLVRAALEATAFQTYDVRLCVCVCVCLLAFMSWTMSLLNIVLLIVVPPRPSSLVSSARKVLAVMCKDIDKPAAGFVLKVDGGMTANNMLMQVSQSVSSYQSASQLTN